VEVNTQINQMKREKARVHLYFSYCSRSNLDSSDPIYENIICDTYSFFFLFTRILPCDMCVCMSVK
jgi:hypothetical protein